MDALSDILGVVRLNGGAYQHSTFSEPWCLSIKRSPDFPDAYIPESEHVILYHYVCEGEFQVKVEGKEPITLREGDVILLPHNNDHLIGSHLDMPPTQGSTVINPPNEDSCLSAIRLEGEGARSRVIFGHLGSDSVEKSPLIKMLPSFLVLRKKDNRSIEWVHSTFKFAADVVASGRSPSETLLIKVSELLFIEAVRHYVETLSEDKTGWIAGLRDPVVSNALALLHEEISHNWTVDELSSKVGLSRTTFTDRFTNIVGQSPITYLTRWRMQIAAHSLRTTSNTLAQIAANVGYESEASFSRAFKRVFGIAPATWRAQN